MSPFSPPPPPFYLVFVFLCLTNFPSHHCHNRRFLHQPLIAEPTTTATPTPPFFPIYSSSPQPPTTVTIPSLPISPANISSNVPQPNQNSSKKKLVVSILVPILSVVLLASVLLFFLHRRGTRGGGTRRPPKEVFSRGLDNHRLFPTDITTSDGRRLSGSAATTTNITTTTGTTATTSTAAPSDRLFFGAIANSRRSIVDDVNSGAGTVAIGVGSPYRKLGSPELHPLPPLQRQSRHVYVNAQGGCCSSSDEEEEAFYSPRENGITPNTSSRGGLISPEKPSSHRYNSISSPTSPSPSSPSPSPPISTSSGGGCSSSGGKSPKSRSEIFTSPIDSKFICSPPLPPPPPPPPPPPLPKQKSPPKDSNKTNTVSQSPPPPPPLPKRRNWVKDPKNSIPITETSSKVPPPAPPKRRNWVKDPKNSIPITETSSKVPPPAPPKRRNWVKDPSKSIPIPENSSKVPPPPPPPQPIGYWETKIQKESKPPPPLIVNHPPTPAMAMPNGTEEETPRTKLKPLHWDKVRASSDRVMVWDQLRSSSFQLNEEMIETLFICNPKTSATKNDSSSDRWQVLPSPSSENRVLDPKKSQNIAILLRALNVTKEEVCEALLEGNTDSFGIELLETLQKMAPTKEEEIKLREYKDDSSPFKLGPAEKFLKAVLDVPFAFKRVEAMICTTNFDSEVNYLRKSFETLEAACEELRNSRMFMKLLEAVLKTGNRMNVGTNRGDAHAFKLDTLLKLVDIKGTDGKTTLLHFVVQEIIRAEGSRNEKKTSNNFKDEVELKRLGLEVVSNLTNELTNVKKSATMDSDVLSSYVTKLASGVRKVNEVIRLNENESKKNGSIDKFHESMTSFLRKAEDKIIRIQAQESVAISLVKEITEYFHGNSVREEPHPFRIFMVVRDFLSVLDQVCKEVGKINNEQSMAGLASRQYPIPVNPTHPAPVFLRFKPQRPPVDDDDESSST